MKTLFSTKYSGNTGAYTLCVGSPTQQKSLLDEALVLTFPYRIIELCCLFLFAVLPRITKMPNISSQYFHFVRSFLNGTWLLANLNFPLNVFQRHIMDHAIFEIYALKTTTYRVLHTEFYIQELPRIPQLCCGVLLVSLKKCIGYNAARGSFTNSRNEESQTALLQVKTDSIVIDWSLHSVEEAEDGNDVEIRFFLLPP